jgi:uncharacterized membrane protein YraQ (UPF0718 family)
MDRQKLKEAATKAAKGIYKSLPVLIGVILLISLSNSLIPKSFYKVLFGNIPILDSFVGAVTGSILAGNPLTSYIIGGELLKQGIGLIAVTAFLVAWVTVGLVQLPAEAMLLGKKFAITRNLTAFIFSIIVAIITAGILNII